MSELPMQIWDSIYSALSKKDRALIAREVISTFEAHGFGVSNNSNLWNHGFKPCKCLDTTTLEPNLGHERCGGTGWLKA